MGAAYVLARPNSVFDATAKGKLGARPVAVASESVPKPTRSRSPFALPEDAVQVGQVDADAPRSDAPVPDSADDDQPSGGYAQDAPAAVPGRKAVKLGPPVILNKHLY